MSPCNSKRYGLAPSIDHDDGVGGRPYVGLVSYVIGFGVYGSSRIAVALHG